MAFDPSTTETTIRVLVADDTRMHTQLLADALRRDRRLEVIGSAAHSRDLLDAIITHKIDVVVLASNLDEESLRGIEVLRELRAARPDLRAIILLDSSRREVVVEAFRAGARGLFSRHESLETLGKCVRRVYEGQVWATNQQTLFAIEALASSPLLRATGPNGLSSLSKREMDVVQCLSEGLTNREIAERLGLSQHTIKNYLFRVFDKLGVSSRLELLSLTLSQPAAGHPRPEARGSDADGSSVEDPAAAYSPAGKGKSRAHRRPEKSVVKDLVSAYAWYLVSEQTNEESKEQVILSKKQLGETLSPEEIIEAQKQALDHLRRLGKAPAVAAGASPARS